VRNGSVLRLVEQGMHNMESIRRSAEDESWNLRPWIWAAVCAAGAFAVNRLVFNADGDAIWRQVAATFVIVATLGFVLTAELRRLLWAVGFALGAGAILAFVGWFTASYNKGGEIAEYPFLAGLFALLIAAPLFQTVRDEGAWRFSYARLHGHVWTDAVIGAASLFFMGVSYLLATLIGQLFNLIGIKFFSDLLRDEWFNALILGFAFGAALGLLRERDALVATLQKLVLVVFSVLAPVLAFALVGFLVSLPFTGLAPLWDSGVPTTPVLLFAAAGAVGLINAVVGDGKADGSSNRVLRWSALLLSLSILPLAVISALSMGVRIGQYGWTPDRIWGLLAVVVACVYGVAYLVSVAKAARAKAPLDWDDHLRPANVKIALGICGLALFLAMPILDFGAMSARDQVARLKSGKTKEAEFDWKAMAFDFGPKGRAALTTLSKSGSEFQKQSAAAALAAESRWNIDEAVKANNVDEYAKNFSYQPADRVLDEAGQRVVLADRQCDKPCKIFWLGENRLVVVSSNYDDGPLISTVYTRLTQAEVDAIMAEDTKKGRAGEVLKANIWQQNNRGLAVQREDVKALTPQSKVEIRTVERQQVYVNDIPVGELFAK
jgi:Domain of unknown function (DUF4153)